VQLTATIEYFAEPGRVFAMLTDQAFQEEVCRATGALRHEVGIEESADGGVTITASRTLPSDPLPDFVRKFAGETLTVRREDRWGPVGADGSREGAVLVEITGAPVRLTGRITLTAAGDGSREQVGGDLKAAIPFIGGKVEKAAQAPILAAIAKEQEVGSDWLAR
jgi:hypothetical protein